MANKFINMIFTITFYIECSITCLNIFRVSHVNTIYFTHLYKRVKRQQNKKNRRREENIFDIV